MAKKKEKKPKGKRIKVGRARKKPKASKKKGRKGRKGQGQYSNLFPTNRQIDSNQYWQLRAEIAGAEAKVRSSLKDKKDEESKAERRAEAKVEKLEKQVKAVQQAQTPGTPQARGSRTQSARTPAERQATSDTYSDGEASSMGRSAVRNPVSAFIDSDAPSTVRRRYAAQSSLSLSPAHSVSFGDTSYDSTDRASSHRDTVAQFATNIEASKQARTQLQETLSTISDSPRTPTKTAPPARPFPTSYKAEVGLDKSVTESLLASRD
eukprot:COSAG02_NODE_14530_length_1261_cov_58.245267_2_plen_265_part_00